MTKKIFLIAGEASGDVLGGALMADLRQLDPTIEFSGIGGDSMAQNGLSSLFPMQELSVMGLGEVLRHLPRLLRRIRQTVKAVLEEKPDILLTIDAPDFGLRVAKAVKKKNPAIKTIHMVAPTVWAWRPGRAEKISRFLDGLLCLFPFEPPYFIPHGLKTLFIGHPLEKLVPMISEGEKQEFYRSYALNKEKPILCLLPGSRNSEIERLLPVFLNVVDQIKITMPDVQVILPTLPQKRHKILNLIGKRHDILVLAPQTTEEKYMAFAVSDVALHASGTVALELALCGTPMITTYRMNAITGWLGRRLIKTPHVNLVNILLNHPVIPELIQQDATVENLSAITQALLSQPLLRDLQREQLAAIRPMLKENAPLAAAHFVQSYLN